MTLEHERRRLGILTERVDDVAGDAEPRAPVRERDHVLAVHLGEDVGVPVVVRERDDGVGVGVDDGVSRQEAVEQRLDRGPGSAGIQESVGEVLDHLRVAHVLPREQRQDVVHAHAREVPALDGLQVRTAPLHPQHGDLAAAVVALDGLDGGVAAAPDDERGLGADQTRGIHEEVEALEPTGLGVGPA